jgi:HAMP domain-containing protein
VTWADVLAWLTTVLGVFGAVLAAMRVMRSDTRNLVEIQHEVWEETRAQLADCRIEVERLRGT